LTVPTGQPARRLLVRQALEIAEHHGRAIFPENRLAADLPGLIPVAKGRDQCGFLAGGSP
jgi:hypothetical protein